MTPRTRRWFAGIASVVVLLYVGRWGVSFLAERWWAATISPAALSAVTRWQLLGIGLDTLAVLLASCWFALQALLVARTVARVATTATVGSLPLREIVPTRFVWFAGLSTGVLLGLITGAGARAWRGPVALAWHGVHYGVVDPLLGKDLGLFVAQLPLWDLAHAFALLLVVLGLALTIILYGGTKGIRRDGNRLTLLPEAQRHLGLLLVIFATLIAIGYLIKPYHIASGADLQLGALAALTRIRAARGMAGIAFGVAVLSLLWAQRGRHALLGGAWCALLICALVERLVVPAMAADVTPPSVSESELRQLESIAWGIREATAPVRTDTIPTPTTLWDEGLLTRWLDSDGRALLGVTPGTIPGEHLATGGWIVAATAGAESHRVDLFGIPEGVTTDSATRLLSLADPRLRPDAPAWRTVPTGVSPGGAFRRLALVWARQAWGMLTAGSARAVDWHLDPAERAAAILPMAAWLAPSPMLIDGRLVWVVQGMLALSDASHASQTRWLGSDVAGVVPAFVATMDAVSGVVKVFFDPGADSVALSWRRFAPGLIAPAADIPTEVRASLPYPAGWLMAQLAVLEGPAWGLGRRPGRDNPDGPAEVALVTWRSPGEVSRIAVFEDPARRVLSAVVTASRVNGVPQLEIERLGRATILNGRELAREWALDPGLARLRDSAAAAGDSVVITQVRWLVGGAGLMAWEPIFAIPAGGRPRLLGMGGVLGDRTGTADRPDGLWKRLQGRDDSAGVPQPPASRQLVAARDWLRQADSALARRDLTAFGRAIEELRKVLEPSPHK
jgi:hypothetical protein